MAEVHVTAAIFTNDFPEFANTPAADITRYIGRAEVFISTYYASESDGNRIKLMIELLTAHMLTISTTGAGFMQASTVHDVSITMAVPPFDKRYDYWLSLSPYGLQLQGLINAVTPPFRYYGGTYNRVL